MGRWHEREEGLGEVGVGGEGYGSEAVRGGGADRAADGLSYTWIDEGNKLTIASRNGRSSVCQVQPLQPTSSSTATTVPVASSSEQLPLTFIRREQIITSPPQRRPSRQAAATINARLISLFWPLREGYCCMPVYLD